jgi:hypothetical protein
MKAVVATSLNRKCGVPGHRLEGEGVQRALDV